MSGQILLGQREIVKQIPEHVCEVSPSFVDNPNLHQFSTIQAALDYIHTASWFGSLGPTSKALVSVAPGEYDEQIHSYEHVVITSRTSGFDTIDTEPPATLYNTGADSLHYPLRSDEDEVFTMVGMNIKTESGGVFGKIPNCNFYSCQFENGDFIERDSSSLSIFSNCTTYGANHGGFFLDGTNLTGNRNIILRNCNIGFHVTPELLSTHTGFANFKCTNVDLEGSLTVKGDWDWRAERCYSYRLVQRNLIDTTGVINIVDSTQLNGMHFVTDPLSFKMINSSFEGISDNKIPAGEADITADVPIIGVVYSGNTQHNGNCGNLQIQCPIKPVGCASLNRYFSVQDAINSIAVAGVVDLRESFTGLSELVIPTSTDVYIDGHKLYSLSFTADIVEVRANSKFGFLDMVNVTGGNMELNGANAEISIESCQYVTGYLTLTLGAFAIVYKASLFGATGRKAVNIDNVNTIAVIGYSRVQGSSGNEAVIFSVDADNKLKVKYSTIIHGSGSTNAPLTYAGVGKVDFQMYNCGLNASWNPADLDNTIGSANNTFDPEITF